MTGRLQVCEPQAEVAKHTHAILQLSSGRELRFVDPRRFGRLSVAQAGDFDATGIEPLEIDLDQFLTLFRGRKTPIKSALLNQKLLRGVGNIYADESLFRAGIRPRRRASAITRDQLGKLLAGLRDVLKEAIDRGGSSISDYVNSDGEEGFFQLQHRVYGRESSPVSSVRRPSSESLSPAAAATTAQNARSDACRRGRNETCHGAEMKHVILRRAHFARRRIWASRAMRRVFCDA